jgi:hypothetical protein
LIAAAGALLLHAVLLQGLLKEAPDDPVAERVTPSAAVETRQVAPPSASVTQVAQQPAPPRPQHQHPALQLSASAAMPQPTKMPRITPPAPRTEVASAAEALKPAATAEVQTVPAAQAAAVEPKPVADGNDPPPVYPFRVPPPATLRYVMGRGPVTGEGELRWQHDGRAYELRLEGRVPLLGTLLTQVSRGGFDAAGLAPERHTDRRRRRAEQAANFQRDAGLVTFSGSSAQYPLVRGAQDRVSWMLQLAGIAQAWRGPLAAGEHITFFVVSARGDGDVWSFRVLGNEAVDLPVGTTQTVKLLREPRKPYDTKVEVWLDPQRHYLPVRARLTDTNGDPLELRLQDEVRAP